MTIQADPFAQVRINRNHPQMNPQPVSQPQQQSPGTTQEDPFAKVRVKKVEGFPGLYEGGRHIARIASRVAETIGGIPGDVQSMIESGVFSGLEKLIGNKVTPEMREEARIKSERAPTTQELRGMTKEATGGFTEPRSDIEKTGDEIASTIASLIGPMKFRKALGLSVGSQMAKEGLKILGTGEGIQEAGKLGTLFSLSLINPKGAMKYATEQYQKASQLSKGASIATPQLEKDLSQLATNLKQGVTTPAKNVVLKPTEELLGKIQQGKIPVHELTAAKRDVNTLMGDPALLKRERNLLKELGGVIDRSIKPYEKINVPFSKAYRPANEIYGAVMQGNKAANFARKYLGAHSILGAALTEAAAGYPEAILPTVGGVAALHGIARGIDFFTRMAKSPELRKYYGKAMLAASAEDIPTLRLYADKIEEAMEKEPHHHRYNKPTKTLSHQQ